MKIKKFNEAIESREFKDIDITEEDREILRNAISVLHKIGNQIGWDYETTDEHGMWNSGLNRVQSAVDLLDYYTNTVKKIERK